MVIKRYFILFKETNVAIQNNNSLLESNLEKIVLENRLNY